MTTGSMLYLAMVLAAFGLFSAVLAYQSWQQSLRGPGMLPVHKPAPLRGAPAKPHADVII
jgi:hypothetical protein